MSKKALFRFVAELNDFLLPERRERTFPCTFKGNQSVKHLIEALGVPHTEVGRIQVDSHAVDFGYQVQDGDQVEVYPVAWLRDNAGETPVQASPQDEPRFVLDNHLGRLAAALRMLGFDAAYQNDYQDEQLVRVALEQGRILLTSDRRLLMRRAVTHGYLVRSQDLETQVNEVLKRFDLSGRITPFRRCLRCNQPLQPVSKAEVLDRLEPLTRRYFDEFHRCPACDQIYWKGSHYERMMQFVKRVAEE